MAKKLAVPKMTYPPLPEMEWDDYRKSWHFQLAVPCLKGRKVVRNRKQIVTDGLVRVNIELESSDRFPSEAQVLAVQHLQDNSRKVIESVMNGCLKAYRVLRSYCKEEDFETWKSMPDIRDGMDLLNHVLLECIFVYAKCKGKFAFTGFPFDSDLEPEHGFGVCMLKETVQAFGNVYSIKPLVPKTKVARIAKTRSKPSGSKKESKPKETSSEKMVPTKKVTIRPEAAEVLKAAETSGSTSGSYYFDDGSSRKFWSYQVSGTNQTIEYGRLGSEGRPVKKSFPSAALALADTEKLIQEKVRKGYVLVDAGRLKLTRSKGKKLATLEEVAAFEKKIGFKLPSQYREFLLKQNGGMPDPQFIDLPGHPNVENCMVGYLRGLYGNMHPIESLDYAVEKEMSCFPKGHLPIARANDIFTISLLGNPGAIYFWDHESPEDEDDDGNVVYRKSDGYLIASSLNEFLTRIAYSKS